MEKFENVTEWPQRSVFIQEKIDRAIKEVRIENIKKSIKMLRLDGNNDSVILNKSLAFYGDDFSKEELSHIIAETK